MRIINVGKRIPKREEIIIRNDDADVYETVKTIISDVRDYKDSKLREYIERFDRTVLESLEVSKDEIDKAFNNVSDRFKQIVEKSIKNISEYHIKQLRQDYRIVSPDGAILGQKTTPIENVLIYVPGGTASYPSTVLMNAIPAKIAGCKNVYMTTPVKDNIIKNELIVAAVMAGVDRIFKIGGAQAIAAFAYGTESVPKVDKIVGPGNVFVAEAKRQVFGKVDIDMIAGPSEILIIADSSSDKSFVAADLLSQAEHDKMATAVLITDNESFAKEVIDEVQKQLEKLDRYDIAKESINNNGIAVITDSIENAVLISNEIAPEHLELSVDEPMKYLDMITNAGSIFLGKYCPEPLGDYLAGPNHTLPTGGCAKFSSPLSVDDFVKRSQYSYFSKESFDIISDMVIDFAEFEGLGGHANSVRVRK